MSAIDVGRLPGTQVALLLGRRAVLSRVPLTPIAGETFARTDATACATQRASAGTVNPVDPNALRYTHYVGLVRTILLESGSTNTYTFCSDFTNGAWSASNLTPVKNAVGADGVAASACTLTTTATSNARCSRSVGSVVVGQYVAISFEVQKGTSAYAAFSDGGDSTTHTAYLNLTTMAWNTRTGIVASGVDTLGNGWYSAWLVYQAASSYTVNSNYYLTGANGTVNCVNGATMLMGRVQEELNKRFPSSVLLTGASAVTRATDVFTIPGVRVAAPATLFYRYWDLATRAWVNAVTPYASLAVIRPPVDRAYQMIAVLHGAPTAYEALSSLRLA